MEAKELRELSPALHHNSLETFLMKPMDLKALGLWT